MEYIERKQSVPVCGTFDAIVAGGGVAGVAAALALRRAGKKVLLIEKTNILGGLATIGLVNYFVPMCNGRGKQIIFGMAEELLRLSIRYGYDSLPAEWADGEPEKPTAARYQTRYSPQIFAIAMTDLLDDAGAKIMFDTIVTGVHMEGPLCRGIFVENKSGCGYYAARMFIDTTGECEILYRAQVPTLARKNYFSYYAHSVSLESCARAVEHKNINALIGMTFAGPANLYGQGQGEDFPFYSGTDAGGVSDYIIRNQRMLLEKLKKDERSSRDIITLPTMPQFRTTRCIEGDRVLRFQDRYQHFSDSVGAINDFDNRDFLFEIPFRSLVRTGFPNLITAGRSASGEGYAWDVLRVIPPAIISGQAAGTAAALALDSGCAIHDVEIQTLQKTLSDANVMIHFPDSYVPGNGQESARIEKTNHF